MGGRFERCLSRGILVPSLGYEMFISYLGTHKQTKIFFLFGRKNERYNPNISLWKGRQRLSSVVIVAYSKVQVHVLVPHNPVDKKPLQTKRKKKEKKQRREIRRHRSLAKKSSPSRPASCTSNHPLELQHNRKSSSPHHYP